MQNYHSKLFMYFFIDCIFCLTNVCEVTTEVPTFPFLFRQVYCDFYCYSEAKLEYCR